jgi:hypothetical protein
MMSTPQATTNCGAGLICGDVRMQRQLWIVEADNYMLISDVSTLILTITLPNILY